LPELDNKSIAVILESMLKANITHVWLNASSALEALFSD
jgi:hypothetical protein